MRRPGVHGKVAGLIKDKVEQGLGLGGWQCIVGQKGTFGCCLAPAPNNYFNFDLPTVTVLMFKATWCWYSYFLDKRSIVCYQTGTTVRLTLIKSWLTKTILATLAHGVICVTSWMMKNKCCGKTSHFLILRAMIRYGVTNSDINHLIVLVRFEALRLTPAHLSSVQFKNVLHGLTNTNNPSLHFLGLTDEWWKQWVVGKKISCVSQFQLRLWPDSRPRSLYLYYLTETTCIILMMNLPPSIILIAPLTMIRKSEIMTRTPEHLVCLQNLQVCNILILFLISQYFICVT